MAKVEYLEGSRPILYRALEKKNTLDLLSEDFCTVSDLPAKIQADVCLKDIPNYAPKAVNIVLQFKKVCKMKRNDGSFYTFHNDHPSDKMVSMENGESVGGIENGRDETTPDHSFGYSVYLAGDPTGSIHVLADDVNVLGKTFVLLHAALHVVNGRIVLQIVRDTKLIECSDSASEFVNPENLSEKYKFELRPAYSTKLNLSDLNNLKSQNDNNHITVTKETLKYVTIQNSSNPTITIFDGTVTLNGSGKPGTITIRVYSVTLNEAGETSNTATIRSLKSATFTITKSGAGTSGNITITLTNSGGSLPLNSNKTNVTLKLTAQGTGAGKLTVTTTDPVIYSGTVTFSGPGSTGQETINIQSVTLIHSHSDNISAPAGSGRTQASQQTVKVTGIGCTPNEGYYIYGTTTETSTDTKVDTNLWNTEWDGGKCEFVECYYKEPGSTSDPALLRFYVRVLGTLKIYYCGKNSTSGGWKTLVRGESLDTKAEVKAEKFNKRFDELVTTGQLSNPLGETPSQVYANKHNTNFPKAITDGKWKPWSPSTWKFTPVKYPLLMQGLSVGAVGSIFPNLIPKTLTCAKTTRTLTVINMFLVTLPQTIIL